MITRRTKIQLVLFVIITLVGVSFVGARYAQLDRLVRDEAYTVVASFEDSGGIFAGGEVTYRGVGIGQVDKLVLTENGVDAYLDIENGYDEIPSATKAIVGNRSAVGEQYVELQPTTDEGPFLDDGSTIPVSMTQIPIQTDQLLTNLSNTVSSVDLDALRIATTSVGEAFAGTGEDLQKIIDTGNSFIEAADQNFEVTKRLIEDGSIVLDGQLASESGIRTFAEQLALFSQSFADADPDLRRIIDTGSFAANQLRGFIEDNRVDFADLLNNLVTTGEIVVANLPGVAHVLTLYPYIVEDGFTVVSKDPDSGLFNAHFGMIMTPKPICTEGYEGTNKRPPNDGSNAPMNEDARCTEPPSVTNARGSQNLPRRIGTNYQAPVAAFDAATGEVTWADGADDASIPSLATRSAAPLSLGKESWKWLYLEPMAGR
ncbi:MAG: MCE family protein [Nocardioides sp.]